MPASYDEIASRYLLAGIEHGEPLLIAVLRDRDTRTLPPDPIALLKACFGEAYFFEHVIGREVEGRIERMLTDPKFKGQIHYIPTT